MKKEQNLDRLNRAILPTDLGAISYQGENNPKVTLEKDNGIVAIHTPYCRDCNICDNCLKLSAYKKMYSTMFNAVTSAEEQIQDAGSILREAQQKCEQIFMDADVTPLILNCKSNEK